MSGYGSDSRRVRGFKWGGDTGRVGVGSHGKSPGGGGGQKDTTGARSGGPGQTREVARTTPAAAAALPGISTQPPAEALRTATDLQNYFSDLQNIALGGQAAQSALARFGIAPEQSYFQYRGSFPEFGDLSGTSGGLAGIIRSLGKMSRTPESFAEGGRVGESMGRRNIQTDVGKFGQMLRDLMLMTDEPTGRQAERLAMAKEAGYVSPAIAQREGVLYQPGGLMPRVDQTIDRVAETIEVSPLPSPVMSREMTQRERELSRSRRMSQAERDLMEAVRNEPDITEVMPPVPGEKPEVPEVPFKGALSYLLDMLRFEDVPYPYTMRDYETDSSFLLSVDEMTKYKALMDEGYSSEEALRMVKEGYAEGGRVGESMGRRNIQTDVGKFGQMLRDLMPMTDEPTGRQAERLAMAEEAGYVSPYIAQREGALYQPGGLRPRVDQTIEVSPLPPPGMSQERTQRERKLARLRLPSQAERDLMEAVRNEPDITEEMLRDLRSMTDEPTGMSREMTQRERELSRSRRISQAERDPMEAVRNEPNITEVMPPVPGERPEPKLTYELILDRLGQDAADLFEQDPAVFYDYYEDNLDSLIPGEKPEIDYKPEIFNFIGREEGSESEGYTLNITKYPNAGVTIANGLDLGQQDEDSLRRMGLTDDLIELFTPYLGLRGADAKAFLEENPLSISPEQKSFVEDKLNEYDYKRFGTFWNSSETFAPWENLKPEQKAVLLSVFRQYGDLPGRTPNFWEYSSTGDWDGVLRELRDFKDDFGPRRNREANLLERGLANGGPVYRRNEALPMIEGDHVVPAKAVKGNEGGLASLSRRLSGNPSYDGMIRGPGGPRDDAIKTRVYAAGGGISGMMDNLQNPFNSVPARVSNKEYVIPRDAINNLGRMAGAPEGMANKAGQDIIYQLVENLKRKA